MDKTTNEVLFVSKWFAINTSIDFSHTIDETGRSRPSDVLARDTSLRPLVPLPI